MLGEVADAQIARFSTGARKRSELSGQELHVGRLAGTVTSQECDAISRRERQFDVLEHDALAVACGLIFERQERPRQFVRLCKREFEG